MLWALNDTHAVNYLFYVSNNNRDEEHWKLGVGIIHQYLIPNRLLAKLIGGD